MAELINKKDALAVVKSIPCATLEEEFTKSTAEGCIKRLPTTTEADIRNKAIDEFAEKLHDLCGVEIGEYQHTDLLHESRIDEIAEQLKLKGE